LEDWLCSPSHFQSTYTLYPFRSPQGRPWIRKQMTGAAKARSSTKKWPKPFVKVALGDFQPLLFLLVQGTPVVKAKKPSCLLRMALVYSDIGNAGNGQAFAKARRRRALGGATQGSEAANGLLCAVLAPLYPVPSAASSRPRSVQARNGDE